MVKRHSRRKTRKVSSKSAKPVLTIPKLRKAFDHMDSVVEKLKNTSKHSFSDAVVVYREEWRKTFKHDLSPADASAYLKFRFGIKGKKAMTRRTKTRGGSMALAGAPLDYQTRPGETGVYGNFPTHMTSGLDRFYGSAITADCGKSGQAGGSWDGFFRPLTPGAPHGSAYIGMMENKGVAAYPSMDPVGPAPLRTHGSSYIPPGNVSPHIRTIGSTPY